MHVCYMADEVCSRTCCLMQNAQDPVKIRINQPYVCERHVLCTYKASLQDKKAVSLHISLLCSF